MPYKQGRKWRGVVKIDGVRYQALRNTKGAAGDWEREKRAELKRMDRQIPTGMDLETLCNKYLDYAARFSANTFQEKKTLCRRILHAFDNVQVADITPDMVLNYLESRARDVSANTYNRDRKNLMAMWTWGRDILDLKTNPIAKIKKRPHDRKPQYTPPTEDILKILAVATREEKAFLSCYLQTGARRSEIFRWTWVDDINFERREYRLGTRKTQDGSMIYEWFPMSDELYADLWWQWNSRPIKNSPWVFVCTSPNHPHYGKPFTYRHKFMKGLCKRAGVRPFGFHALRRYVASVLADTHKVSAKRIQRILRHQSLATTERYIHHINQDLQGTLNLLSETKVPQAGTPTYNGVSPSKS